MGYHLLTAYSAAVVLQWLSPQLGRLFLQQHTSVQHEAWHTRSALRLCGRRTVKIDVHQLPLSPDELSRYCSICRIAVMVLSSSSLVCSESVYRYLHPSYILSQPLSNSDAQHLTWSTSAFSIDAQSSVLSTWSDTKEMWNQNTVYARR